MEKAPDLRLVTQEPIRQPAHAHAAPPQLGLTFLEQAAAAALAAGDTRRLLELIRDRAQALATDDQAVCRVWAKEVAIAQGAVDMLVAALGDRIKANDEKGALLADRLATSAMRRLTMLLAVGPGTRRGTTVAVGHADVVTVEAGG